jgi:hypothetical protein
MLPFVLAFLALALAELFLSLTWNYAYFFYGIPIFSRQVDIYDRAAVLPSPDEMDEKFQSALGMSMAFKVLSENDMAFREKAVQFSFFRYAPVMHGIIKVQPAERSVRVVGMLNWSMAGFSALFFYIVRTTRLCNVTALALIMFVLAMGLNYALQARKFSRIGDTLEDHYRRRHDVMRDIRF